MGVDRTDPRRIVRHPAGRSPELQSDRSVSEDEAAFYDAPAANESAVEVLGDETLKKIAREPVDRVRGSVTVDWSRRENARAHLRVLVKRILRRHGYPPDQQERATDLVLEQTEVLCHDWIAA